MPYDIFISYSRKDNATGRITQLVERIRRDFESFAGRPLLPYFDITEIHGMEDWRHRIMQGLRESHLLLACLSPSYLQSKYCEWEFNEYLKHEIGRAYFGDGVAPIYFVEVPGWGAKGFEQQCAAWVAELRRRQHFDLRPWFHAGEECLRDASVQERLRQLNTQLKERITRGERAEHSLGNVDAHNPHFIGRTTELRRLRETVALGKVGVLTAVHGLGGVGKTALAIEYAHAFAHEYGGGRWQVRCEGKEDLRAAIAELAAPLTLEFNEDEKKDTDRQFQRVLAELRRLAEAHEPHRCLLLLDNVDKSRLLEPAQAQRLPAEDWLHVLATTRLGENELHSKQKDRVFLPVDELPEADALELIETYQPGGAFPSNAEREAAREIVNLLGRFTLAVETASVYLGQFADDVTCAGFLARLKKEGLAGLDIAAEQTSEGLRHGEKRLAATLAPTLERLTEPEKLALSYASLLPADYIALPWIRALVAEKFPDIGKDAEPGYPDSWKNLLRLLLSLRLLQITNVLDADGQPLVVRMHRVLSETVNRKKSTNRQCELALGRHVCARTARLVDLWWGGDSRWEIDPLLALALNNQSWLNPDSFAGELGWVLVQLGRLSAAAEILGPIVQEALTDTPTSERFLVAVRSMCLLKSKQGVYAEAICFGKIAYQGYQKLFGLDHLDALRSLNLLCLTRIRHGDLSEIEPVVRDAVDRSRRALGEMHPEAITSRSNLAYLLTRKQGYAEAEFICREALASRNTNLGSDHPDTLISLDLLGFILSRRGRVDEAYAVMQQLLAKRKTSLGADHPDTINAMSGIALELLIRGKVNEAEQLAMQALSAAEQSIGKDNPATLMAMQRVVEVLGKKGDLKRARDVAVTLMNTAESSLGPDNAFTTAALSMLAAIASRDGDLDINDDVLRKALESRERVLGPEHPDTVYWVTAFANLLQRKGDSAQAEVLLRRALATQERMLGPEHPDTLTSVNSLAFLLESKGEYAVAEPLFRRALEAREREQGSDHPATLTSVNNLAILLSRKGDSTHAEPLYRRAMEASERVLGPEHPQTLVNLNNLAGLLASKGDYTGAEALYRRALEARERILGPQHPETVTTRQNLVRLLDRLGKLDEASQLHNEV